MAGPERIECVKVEVPLRLLEKSASRGLGGGGGTDVCDLCLTPRGISATDNLIQHSA